MAVNGYIIKKLRKEAGFTQVELGEQLGVIKQTISSWENNVSEPNSETLTAISKLFGVSVDYLLGNSSDSSIASNQSVSSLKDNSGHQSDDFNNHLASEGKCHSTFIKLLESSNMTIDDVVKSTGLEKDVLTSWFVNEIPSVKQLVLVADCLNTSVDYLLGRNNQSEQLSIEDKEVLSYYNQLNKMDKRWAVGQMIDLIKKYESEEDLSCTSNNPQRKASGK